MLVNVPSAVNRMARNVVMNHPNTWECQVFRKTVTRTGALVGGLPVLGGLGVMNSEDEDEVVWTWIGNGYALQAEAFSPSAMMDRKDANNGSASETKFLIEPEYPTGMPGNFDLRTHDVFYLVLSDDMKVAFEIIGIETVLNIPPYVTRYTANRRDDLRVTAG